MNKELSFNEVKVELRKLLEERVQLNKEIRELELEYNRLWENQDK